ncbi:MAG TPA: hypothetical protein VFA48_03020 [Gammaproteobacteria bacterium]|nr:hypothetical protein [Gammaproteobacteria bacterium]
MGMEINAKEFGELIGEIRALASKVDQMGKSVSHLTENYVGRQEYERRHAELAKDMHRRDLQLETRLELHAADIADNKKAIEKMSIVDAKGDVRDRLLEHVGAALFGGMITFLIIAVTHYLHLI